MWYSVTDTSIPDTLYNDQVRVTNYNLRYLNILVFHFHNHINQFGAPPTSEGGEIGLKAHRIRVRTSYKVCGDQCIIEDP